MTALLLLLIVGLTFILWRQPQSPAPLSFKVGDLGDPSLTCLEGMNSAYLAGPGKSGGRVQRMGRSPTHTLLKEHVVGFPL